MIAGLPIDPVLLILIGGVVIVLYFALRPFIEEWRGRRAYRNRIKKKEQVRRAAEQKKQALAQEKKQEDDKRQRKVASRAAETKAAKGKAVPEEAVMAAVERPLEISETSGVPPERLLSFVSQPLPWRKALMIVGIVLLFTVVAAVICQRMLPTLPLFAKALVSVAVGIVAAIVYGWWVLLILPRRKAAMQMVNPTVDSQSTDSVSPVVDSTTPTPLGSAAEVIIPPPVSAQPVGTTRPLSIGDVQGLQDELDRISKLAWDEESLDQARNVANEALRKAEEAQKDADAVSSRLDDLEPRQTTLATKEELRQVKEELEQRKEVGELRKYIEERATAVKKLFDGGNAVMLGMLLEGNDVAPSLLDSVRSRYALLALSDAYRRRLSEWGRSAEVLLVMRHYYDLLVRSRQTHMDRQSIGSLTPLREAHWSRLNQSASARLGGITAFLDRIGRWSGGLDTSDGGFAANLRGLRSREERFGWSCISRPDKDHAIALTPSSTEKQLRLSAAKLLELIAFPVILLYQELFEAPQREDRASPEAHIDYEQGTFRDGTVRGSVEDAAAGMASMLGYTYRPLTLYQSIHSEAGRLVHKDERTRVPLDEWLGISFGLDGSLIVRLHRPAFTQASSEELLLGGAAAVIGVRTNANRT